MGGWASKSEQAICLNCHRAIDFHWRESEGGLTLEAIGPTRAVAREADETRKEVTWVTLQNRCRCGTTIGCLVELVAAPALTA
jgi:hypothetical protein